jgi:ketosteroid isomerase-like protein
MSKESVALVRAAFAAWVREDMEQFAALLKPTARIDLTGNVFNPDVYEGYDSFVAQRAEIAQTWQFFNIEVEDVFERDDVVVALTHEHGRGRASGVAARSSRPARPDAGLRRPLSANVT